MIKLMPILKKGFATTIVIFILIALATAGSIVYFYNQPKESAQQTNQVNESSPISDETANWKTYTNSKHNFTLKYPNDWSFEENGIGVLMSPTARVMPAEAISVSIINYKLTPPLPVNYSYQTLRKVHIDDVDILIQVRQPDSAQYMAQIVNGDLTAEFKYGMALDRKYDKVFDQILSTFKFL